MGVLLIDASSSSRLPFCLNANVTRPSRKREREKTAVIGAVVFERIGETINGFRTMQETAVSDSEF
jgi:hypothetical protein